MAARRSLDTLKVTELRSELDARNEDSSGLKSALASRMKEILIKEGKDPDDFELGSPAGKVPVEAVNGPNKKTEVTDGDEKEQAKSKSSEPSSMEGTTKNCEENSPLIVHVGDATDDLDYDLAGKRDNEEDTKDNAANSDNATAEADSKANSKNLWVANMSKNVKAAELRSHFSTVGKVLAARVFLNKAPGAQSKCYGLVQMATVEDADRCVKDLNRSMLAGQRIYVDKAKTDMTFAATKRPASTNANSGAAKKIATTPAPVPAPAAVSPVKKEVEKKESTKLDSVKKEKVEVSKDNEKKSTSTVVKDESSNQQPSAREKEKLEMVKKKEEDLEKLKQRQLQLAKTQRLEFDRLAREKERLRHEREAIERERRNLRRMRKEVEGKNSERQGPSRQSWDERSRSKDDRRRSPEPSASSDTRRNDRNNDRNRFQPMSRDSKSYQRPSAPSSSDRQTSVRHYDNESKCSRPERESGSSYRRQDDRQDRQDRQEERQDNRYGGSAYSNRSDSNSGYRYTDYGGESSRVRARGYEGHQDNRPAARGGYEQSTSKYKKDSTSVSYTSRDNYDGYSRDYNNYSSETRRQPAVSSSSYYKEYATDNDYSRDRSPQRSSDRHGGSSSYTRHNPYYTSGSGGGEHGMSSSHRGSSSGVAPGFLGGSSSNLGSSSNAPSSSSPMFLGGGGSSSGSSFPPSGSTYYGAASLAASALANSAAASSMRYDAYAAAAAASGRNISGSMYHHSRY